MIKKTAYCIIYGLIIVHFYMGRVLAWAMAWADDTDFMVAGDTGFMFEDGRNTPDDGIFYGDQD